LVVFEEWPEEMYVEQLEEHARCGLAWVSVVARDRNLLHYKHAWQTPFFRLQFFWQFSPPCLEPLMDLAKFLQLTLLALRFVHIDRIIEKVHEIAGNLTEFCYLSSDLQ
jgi:hypothetical protein